MSRIRKLVLYSCLLMPAIIPVGCSRELLKELTPFLISGSNEFMVDFINAAAPLVLP